MDIPHHTLIRIEGDIKLLTALGLWSYFQPKDNAYEINLEPKGAQPYFIRRLKTDVLIYLRLHGY